MESAIIKEQKNIPVEWKNYRDIEQFEKMLKKYMSVKKKYLTG